MNNDKVKWSYLAGIIDGEGTIAINTHNNPTKEFPNRVQTYALEICIVNTDERLMKWLIQHFGGQYYGRERADKVNHRRAYAWRVTGHANRKRTLLALLPYLVMKREQAILGLKYLDLHYSHSNDERRKLWEMSIKLNARGKETVTTNTREAIEVEIAKIESELHSDMQSGPVVIQVQNAA